MKKLFFLLSYIFIFYCLFYNTYCTGIEYNDSTTQNNNVFLQELRVNYEGIVPEFQKDIYKYYLTVSKEINEIEVVATAQNPNSTIEITGNTNLKNGLNIITIKVSSEDDMQSNVYTIEVTKTDNIELANTNLEILAIENSLLNPPFDANITNYEVEVSNETDKINILAIPQNENSKIEITEIEKLKEGDNFIDVNVIAENGFSKKTYTINIYKRNEEETIKFIEDEKINQEKLSGIYNIQKTSLETEKDNREVKKNDNNIFKIFFCGLVVSLGTIIILLIKKKTD